MHYSKRLIKFFSFCCLVKIKDNRGFCPPSAATHNQYAMSAAIWIAARKLSARLSYHVAIRRKSFNRQNIRSTALRARYRNGLKQPFHSRFALNGMLGPAPRLSMKRRMALASYALSAMTMAPAWRSSSSTAACGASAAFPPVSRKAIGLPAPSLSAWILVFRPPRLTPMAWANTPLFRQRRSDALSRVYYRAGPPLGDRPQQRAP